MPTFCTQKAMYGSQRNLPHVQPSLVLRSRARPCLSMEFLLSTDAFVGDSSLKVGARNRHRSGQRLPGLVELVLWPLRPHSSNIEPILTCLRPFCDTSHTFLSWYDQQHQDFRKQTRARQAVRSRLREGFAEIPRCVHTTAARRLHTCFFVV